MTLLEDSDFQDMEADRTPIQLRPQRVKVRIPPYSKMTIPIHYRLAKYVSLTDLLNFEIIQFEVTNQMNKNKRIQLIILYNSLNLE